MCVLTHANAHPSQCWLNLRVATSIFAVDSGKSVHARISGDFCLSRQFPFTHTHTLYFQWNTAFSFTDYFKGTHSLQSLTITRVNKPLFALLLPTISISHPETHTFILAVSEGSERLFEAAHERVYAGRVMNDLFRCSSLWPGHHVWTLQTHIHPTVSDQFTSPGTYVELYQLRKREQKERRKPSLSYENILLWM